jgi:phage baseplate assembly protein gpV
VGFCERDISVVKKTKDISNPGSLRQYSKSDGVWIVTVWASQAPTQYILFVDGGVSIVSPVAITLQAPTINLQGDVVQTAGDVTMAGALDVAGVIHSDTDVESDNISGKTHTHGGVTAGGDNTAVPNP